MKGLYDRPPLLMSIFSVKDVSSFHTLLYDTSAVINIY